MGIAILLEKPAQLEPAHSSLRMSAVGLQQSAKFLKAEGRRLKAEG